MSDSSFRNDSLDYTTYQEKLLRETPMVIQTEYKNYPKEELIKRLTVEEDEETSREPSWYELLTPEQEKELNLKRRPHLKNIDVLRNANEEYLRTFVRNEQQKEKPIQAVQGLDPDTFDFIDLQDKLIKRAWGIILKIERSFGSPE